MKEWWKYKIKESRIPEIKKCRNPGSTLVHRQTEISKGKWHWAASDLHKLSRSSAEMLQMQTIRVKFVVPCRFPTVMSSSQCRTHLCLARNMYRNSRAWILGVYGSERGRRHTLMTAFRIQNLGDLLIVGSRFSGYARICWWQQLGTSHRRKGGCSFQSWGKIGFCAVKVQAWNGPSWEHLRFIIQGMLEICSGKEKK